MERSRAVRGAKVAIWAAVGSGICFYISEVAAGRVVCERPPAVEQTSPPAPATTPTLSQSTSPVESSVLPTSLPPVAPDVCKPDVPTAEWVAKGFRGFSVVLLGGAIVSLAAGAAPESVINLFKRTGSN